MQRRLAAIMIADVVGYSRLSQIDEEGTRARFSADLKEIFEPKIAAYRGRLVKTMGDGLLVEFPSVVEALRCAVEVQQEMARRNATKPAGQRLNFRIGINLGDIIIEGDDIQGDGVNIAARIQALAEPGGIAISGAAYDQVKSKLPIAYASLGRQKLKNIAEPMQAYKVLLDASAAKEVKTARKWVPAGLVLILLAVGGLAWLWPGWRALDNAARFEQASRAAPSLVVLPFDNISDDTEQAYLADGMTEDLTTELARTPGLFVVSSNAASTYEDKKMTPTEIAKQLGVRYLLEGSVRRAGDQLRINAQLIDGTSGGHIWAERFDGSWNEVFAVEDRVIAKVTSALKLQLITGPRMAKAPGGTTVPAAYELYLRWYGLENPTDSESVSLLMQAVSLDPDYGQAWAELAWIYWTGLDDETRGSALGVSHAEAVAKIKELLRQAEKHPSSSYHQLKADLLLWQRHWDEAIANAERAIAMDPSDPYGYEEMSAALIYGGRATDAQPYLESAMRVDPGETAYRHFLAGLIAFSSARFADAIGSLDEANPQELGNDATRRQRLILLTAAHAQLGQAEKAASARAELEKLAPGMTIFGALHNLPFRSSDDIERLRTGLSKAGLSDLPSSFRWDSKERLKGDEIRKLVFGHTLNGQSSSGPYHRETTKDGQARVSIGSTFSSTGVSWMESDLVCTVFDIEIEATCAMIFRNPAGTAAKQNEYAWVTAWEHVEFSVVGDDLGSKSSSDP